MIIKQQVQINCVCLSRLPGGSEGHNPVINAWICQLKLCTNIFYSSVIKLRLPLALPMYCWKEVYHMRINSLILFDTVCCICVCETYLDAWGGEVWDLKLDTDWWFSLFIFSFYTWQTKVSSHQILLSTLWQVKTQTLEDETKTWEKHKGFFNS